MGIIEEEAFATFVRYYQDLGKININEPAEEGSVVEQIQYFIQFLISKPEIKLILEIGFNSGSSAASFLSSRDDIKVISVDIGEHNYVNDCKRLIDMHFPGRHTLIIGDSKRVIPELNKAENKTSPDLIFIDGDHIEPTPLIDARNCIAMARLDTILIMDDTNLHTGWNGVLQAMCTLLRNKEINGHMICIYVKNRSWTLFNKMIA